MAMYTSTVVVFCMIHPNNNLFFYRTWRKHSVITRDVSDPLKNPTVYTTNGNQAKRKAARDNELFLGTDRTLHDPDVTNRQAD